MSQSTSTSSPITRAAPARSAGRQCPRHGWSCRRRPRTGAARRSPPPTRSRHDPVCMRTAIRVIRGSCRRCGEQALLVDLHRPHSTPCFTCVVIANSALSDGHHALLLPHVKWVHQTTERYYGASIQLQSFCTPVAPPLFSPYHCTSQSHTPERTLKDWELVPKQAEACVCGATATVLAPAGCWWARPRRRPCTAGSRSRAPPSAAPLPGSATPTPAPRGSAHHRSSCRVFQGSRSYAQARPQLQ